MEASFDTWTTLFLVVSAVGTFLSVVLFTDTKGRVHNWPIALIILGFSLILVQYVLFWTGYNKVYPYLHFYAQSWYLTFGPLLYVYILKHYIKDFNISFYHFIPAVLSFSLTAYFMVVTEGFENTESFQDNFFYNLQFTLRSSWLATLSFFVYLWVIKDTLKLIDSHPVSEVTNLRNKWTGFLMKLFAVFGIAYTSYFVLVNFDFFNVAWDYAISVTMSLGIYGIGYMVYTEPQIFNGELFYKLFSTTNGKEESLSDETKEEFYNSIVNYCTSEKPYKKNDLRMAHIADQLGFSTHLLSQIVNERGNKNFNRFINEFRLQEAEQLLNSSEIQKVSNIYYEVGFNSKATFYNLFKKKHGCTPTEYRSQKGKG